MKPTSTILGVMLLWLSFAASQGTTFPSQSGQEGTDLYLRALTIYLDTTYQAYGHLNTGRDWFNRYFEADRGIAEIIPDQIGSVRVVWIWSDSAMLRDVKTKHLEVPVTRIAPLENIGDTMVISFSDYQFSIGDTSSYYAIEGGCVVRFKYNCDRNEFDVIHVRLWGV